MPLDHSKSPGAFRTNVSTLMHDVGKSPHVQSREQALAIAYNTARRAGAKMASGGFTPPMGEHFAARQQFREGFLHSSVPGRTDRLPISVAGGAYVLPADHVAALGQNNSQAGAKILDAMFHGTPFGGKPMRASGGVHMPRLGQLKMPKMRADGGGTEHHVPIVAAGGEYIIPPEAIKAKFGDIDRGHQILDRWVTRTRKHHIKTLKRLPPP